MKVNQIVGEHKKGMRAKKYARKPQKYIEPTKPQGPQGPGEIKKQHVDEVAANVAVKPIVGAQEIDVNGQKIATASDAQSAATIAQLAKDGKIVPNTSNNPNATTGGTAPMEEEPSGPAPMEEEPSGPAYVVNTKVNPPLVLTKDNTTGVPLRPASGEITPELIARSKPDWQEVLIQANGKQYPALGTHREIRVSPSVYQQIVGPQMRESEDTALLQKMLTIAGIK